MKIAIQDKQRVLLAGRNGGNWQAVAETLSINCKTAWLWIAIAERDGNWVVSPSKRGGFRYKRVTSTMEDYLEERIDENCHFSLGEVADALLSKFGVKVCPQTVKNAVDGLGYTLKSIHKESDNVMG